MDIRKNIFISALLISVFVLSSCCILPGGKVYITDAKTAMGIDKELLPIDPTGFFLKGTSKVFCWFQWKNAEINTPIIAKWHYITDDIAVLDYTFSIPRKKGEGSVSLSMPEGKALPSGLYKVELTSEGRILKALKFKIE